MKLNNAQLDWRDSEGFSLLHIACWLGNLTLLKSFCQDTKVRVLVGNSKLCLQGRLLLSTRSKAGLSPLGMAVVNTQTKLVKEYLSNIVSKTEVDLGKEELPGQSLFSLLILNCPDVSPGLLLQRKDATEKLLNSVDNQGNTILMALAARDSRETLRRIFLCRSVSQSPFDFCKTNVQGQNLLHLLVQNNDKHSVQMLLNLVNNGKEILNCLDKSQESPLMVAYAKGFYAVADSLVNHPKTKSHLDWTLRDKRGRTLSSQAEEAKKKRLEVKEPGLNYVKVKHKATKRNFPKEDTNKEVKEKQAKTSNGTPTTEKDDSIKTNGIQNGHGPHENDITMDDNEELRWIAQVTREKEEAERKADEQKKIEEEKKKSENNKIESKESKTVKPAYKMTQQEKWLEMQRQKEEEKKKAEEKGSSSVSQASSYSSPPCHHHCSHHLILNIQITLIAGKPVGKHCGSL